MPLSLVATSTAALGLMRSLGGAIGASIGDAIFASELARRLNKIPAYVTSQNGTPLTNDIQGLSHIQVSLLPLFSTTG